MLIFQIDEKLKKQKWNIKDPKGNFMEYGSLIISTNQKYFSDVSQFRAEIVEW